MKTIAFDARLAGHPGIGRYLVSLLEAMLSRETPYHFVLIGDPARLKRFEKFSNVSLRACHVPIYGLEEQFRMNVFFEDADVVHVPHFNVPLKCPKNLVVTIHDLIYFKFRDYQPFPGYQLFLRMIFNRIAKRAQWIITVSRATQEDCEMRFPLMNGKIRVIPEAADPAFSPQKDAASEGIRQKFNLSRPYILSVGSIREHKNIQSLLAAYERLVQRGAEVDLVLVGRVDARFEKKYQFKSRLQKAPGIRHLENLNDEEIRGLYCEAACFVMPSFYEGFGLPVLEAMACGAPVIVSDTASLTETAGKAALTFDPAKIDELTEVLYNLLSDKELQQKLSSLGLQRASGFSWNKAAIETLNLYQEVLAIRGTDLTLKACL